MNNFLIALAVFVITVVGALFAVPYFIDWNSYRRAFELEASRVIGREVQVDGDVKLHLLPTPYFRVEKVRIADRSQSRSGPFFRTESLTVKLSIPPMFRGIVEANDIEFQRPIVRLAHDADGEWNWQSLARALGSAAYMPSNVTLTSLKIANGVLVLHGPDGAERARLERVNGELSAPTLHGPYRFRGIFLSGGTEREIRLSTGPPEADGGLRVRALLRVPDTGASYLLDARVADLMGKPRVDGELTARLPIAGLWQPLPQGSAARKTIGSEEVHAGDRGDAAFELKAAVKADADGAVLSDLALTFEQDGRPQLVSGSVQASWRNALALDMRLTSRWLDLDRISGATGNSGPLQSIAKIAAGVRDLLPGQGRSRATIAIAQAKLGGETIGDIHLSIARSEDKLVVEALRAGLPGGSHGDLKGVVSGPPDGLAFKGALALRGPSVARFATWVTGSALPVDAKSDGAFSIATQLTVAAGQVEASALDANLSGTSLNGKASYRWADRPQIMVALEAPQLDARAFLPSGASLADVFGLLRGALSAKVDAGKATGRRDAQPDIVLRLKAGQAITPDRSYRDVVASMDLRSGHLQGLLLRLSLDDGFQLELEGNVDDLARHPKGSLRGAVVAETAAGVAALMQLFGVPDALRPNPGRNRFLAPLRLAGSMTFGKRLATSADLMVDGEANGMTVSLNARFDGGADGWRSGRAEVSASADANDAAKLVSLLSATDASGGSAAPGRALIRADGVPSEGLTSIATIEAGDLGLKFRGKLTVADAGVGAAGHLDIRARDGARVAALAGLPPLAMDGLPLRASLELSMAEGTVGFDKLSVKLGGSMVSGRIKLSPNGERRHVEASLHANALSVAQLLAPLLDQRLAVAGMAEAAISGRKSVWPDEPFGFAALEGFDGQVLVDCTRLTLADGMALKDAKVAVALDGGNIALNEISGRALGGQFKAKLRIGKVPAGAEVRGDLSFAVDLQHFQTGSPRASGPMSGSIEFTGRGASPRAIVAALQGKGSIEFGEAKLTALWPGAVALAADAALEKEPEKLAATVRQSLLAGLAAGPLPLGPRTLALEIAAGRVEVKSFVIDTGEGRASGAAGLDLKTLMLDSQWRLESSAPKAGTKPLPVVTVEYHGPLAALGTLEPRIGSAALEQELSARRIEREVEELERLRRLDEQRRLLESERLRRQFDQTPPVQRPPLPPGVPVAPSGREPRPAAPG
jgi:hypothetical protein